MEKGSGSGPVPAIELAGDLNTEEALDVAERIIKFYEMHVKKWIV